MSGMIMELVRAAIWWTSEHFILSVVLPACCNAYRKTNIPITAKSKFFMKKLGQ